MAWPVCFYDLIRDWTDLSWHIDLNGNLSDPVPWIRKLNSGGGKTFKRGPFTLSSVCAVIFSDSPRVCVCVCVRKRDRYWLMFLKFTWHLTGLVKSKQITLAPIKTEYSMHQIKMIIRVSHCSYSTIIVSGHNAGSTERGRLTDMMEGDKQRPAQKMNR